MSGNGSGLEVGCSHDIGREADHPSPVHPGLELIQQVLGVQGTYRKKVVKRFAVQAGHFTKAAMTELSVFRDS